MKQVNNDLREALRLSEPKTPQLSADFADRLAERLQEDGTTSDVSPNHLNSPYSPHRWYRRVAAIFIGVLIIGGIAIAAWMAAPKASHPDTEATTIVQKSNVSPSGDEGGARSFTNIRLDSLLTIVAKHYGCTVVYRDEQPRTLRISTTWNQSQPLDAFIALLNELDGLRLTTEDDTIFVNNK